MIFGICSSLPSYPGTPKVFFRADASQVGMFSYTGLNEEQVRQLRDIYHVYLFSSGRASISGRKCSKPKNQTIVSILKAE